MYQDAAVCIPPAFYRINQFHIRFQHESFNKSTSSDSNIQKGGNFQSLYLLQLHLNLIHNQVTGYSGFVQIPPKILPHSLDSRKVSTCFLNPYPPITILFCYTSIFFTNILVFSIINFHKSAKILVFNRRHIFGINLLHGQK